MKLRLGTKALKAVMRPYQATVIDIIGINPRVEVGQFKCCALNMIPSGVLIVSDGIIMKYNTLEDFINGTDPLALVKDESIHYDQGLTEINFQIVNDENEEVSQEDFAPVRELMFGARVEPEVHNENS